MAAKIVRFPYRYREERERIYSGDEPPEMGTYTPQDEYGRRKESPRKVHYC